MPYDHTLKSLADADPEALLRRLGVLRPDEPATIGTPPRELRAPARVPDLLYEVHSNHARRLVHIEAQTRYQASLPDRMLEYASLAWLQYHMPVFSYVLLLTARDCPSSLAHEMESTAGALTVRYRVVKLWEVDAHEVLALDRPSLVPFVPLMRGGEAELTMGIQRLSLIADEKARRDLSFRFALLGRLRYNRDAQFKSLENLMFALDDPLRESPLFQEILEEGIEEGEARVLRRQLERRFGTLPPWAVDKIRAASAETIEAWTIRIVETPASRLEDLLA